MPRAMSFDCRRNLLLINETIAVLILTLLLTTLSSCVGHQPAKTMQPCHDTYKKMPDAKVLNKSLVKAQAWSDKIYGDDCYVCAEVYAVEKDSFTLHITSPVDGMLINTSATIEFDMQGQVVEKTQYHSCHARIKKTERNLK
jgi:hypothetical protein